MAEDQFAPRSSSQRSREGLCQHKSNGMLVPMDASAPHEFVGWPRTIAHSCGVSCTPPGTSARRAGRGAQITPLQIRGFSSLFRLSAHGMPQSAVLGVQTQTADGLCVPARPLNTAARGRWPTRGETCRWNDSRTAPGSVLHDLLRWSDPWTSAGCQEVGLCGWERAACHAGSRSTALANGLAQRPWPTASPAARGVPARSHSWACATCDAGFGQARRPSTMLGL